MGEHYCSSQILKEGKHHGPGNEAMCCTHHLISQDGIEVLGVKESQPTQANKLVGLQLQARGREGGREH